MTSSSLRNTWVAAETTTTTTLTQMTTANFTETVTTTMTTVYAFLPTTIYVTKTSTLLVPTAMEFLWTTTIHSTKTDVVTTQTVTTRIWTAALYDYYDLPILCVAFFTAYVSFVRFKRSATSEDRLTGVGALIAALVTGVFSMTRDPETPYFYLSGIILGALVWIVVDKCGQR